MRRLGHSLLGVVVTMAALAGTASADIEWCAEDPVFIVLGSQFRLTTNVATSAGNVSGIRYVVTLPSDAEGSAAAFFPRSPRLPATVEFRYSGPAAEGGSFSVTAAVTASASSDAAVRVDLAGPTVEATSFDGTANRQIRAKFSVSGK